jgi:hypothetical protein
MIRGSTKATNSDGGGSERWELSIEPETFFSTEAVIGCSYVCQGTKTEEGRALGAVRIR